MVDSFSPDDKYDLVMIVMGEHQVIQILGTLAENDHIPTFLFMGNNVSGPEKMVQALCKERVMLGFPYPGGKRDDHVMRVLPINESCTYTIPIGEVDGTVRHRTRQIAAVLEDMRGYNVEIRTDMETWLKYHVALLMSGFVPALFAADTKMKRLGNTRDLLVVAARTTKEALRGLRRAGYSPSPPIVRIFEYVPEPICVWIMRNEYGKVSIEGHAQAAQGEMSYLFSELRSLIEETDGNTDAIEQLASHYDPSTPLYPEGRQEIPMNWNGLVIPAGIGMLALAFAVRQLRFSQSSEPVAGQHSDHLHYEVTGPKDATTLVFTHGFALDHETWQDQIVTFSNTNRVFVWDVPGCGSSDDVTAPVRFETASSRLIDSLDNEGIDQAVFVGQSMGSLLNQYIAYHHPDRVQTLVHVGGFPLHNGFSERTIKLMQIHVKMLQLMPSKAIYNTFGQLVAQNPDAQAYAREASQRTGKKNIVSLEREFLMDLQEGIPEHPEQPQLILNGEP